MIFTFEDYSLDTDRQELCRGTARVPIEPQVFDLLHYLISNRARVVSKDDLIAAVWKGRVISESTLSSRITAVRHAVGDCAEYQRLIRTVPRKGIRFVGSIRQVTITQEHPPDHDPTAITAPLLPNKPSVAVLPFVNMSEDAAQEYFADGLTDDVITALSRFSWLFVIARNSSFAFKGKSIDRMQIAQEFGVRYLLEGSVRKAANRVRIAARLIEASTMVQLWADKFDGSIADIFDLQDRVTASVVTAIAPKLELIEIDRARRKPTKNLDAYDYYLRGVASTFLYTRESTSDALQQFYRAIDLDPNFAAPYGIAAWCFAHLKAHGWLSDPKNGVAETARLVRRAVEIGNDDAIALSWAGFALAYVVHDLDDAIVYVDRALMLNPNLASSWVSSGWLRVYAGDSEGALDRFSHAMRLSPLDLLSFRMQTGVAYAHIFAGRYDEASAWSDRALRARPNYLSAIRAGSASHALAGRRAEAQKLMERLRKLDPALRVSNLKELLPIRRPEDFVRWSDGLRKAGLPE